MGSYFREGERHYGGYDEYAGIFGPLQAAPASASRHGVRYNAQSMRSRRGPTAPRAKTSSSRTSSIRRRRGPQQYERRATFLASRKAKRLETGAQEGVDALGEDDGEEIESGEYVGKRHEPLQSLPVSERQVWLPSRTFAFQQRAGKLDTRAIARLDLEKIAATTDVEAIQRHLENLTFADVTLDDVQHYSDAYFLKLFQIAQLTLEYLMHVQDSLVEHSDGLETQCEELLVECQDLETENSQHETEIASLKREIRQKQRTMATLELMLLNASASSRPSATGEENAADEANRVVDELLKDSTNPAVVEEGVISKPVTCVLCEKKFVSAEYLIRHQQRKHQDQRRKKNQQQKKISECSASSGSGSDDDGRKRSKKTVKTVPLPKEVIDALEEKNQLAKQLVALQSHVYAEQEARDKQRQHLEGQQMQLGSQMEQYMAKLQAALMDIEKKQEASKQDMRQYTEETISRLQTEAANAKLLQQKASRAGTLEDDGDYEQMRVKAKAQSEDSKWADKVEKMMDTFLRAQAQKQQEIDALEQENSKLWSKHSKLKKRRQQRPEPSLMLMDMAALDAQRFGVDRGEVEEAKGHQVELKPFVKAAALEDKLVQTDDENDDQSRSKKEQTAVVTCTQEIQTDAEPAKETKVPSITIPRVPIQAVESKIPPPSDPKPVRKVRPAAVMVSPVVEIPTAAVVETPRSDDPQLKVQRAAHIIGKVALGFLTRRALSKSSNWLISIPIASLETSLSAAELECVRRRHGHEIQIQVEETTTANSLRVGLAQALSGENELESCTDTRHGGGRSGWRTEISYHRVLLYHRWTGRELCGDKLRIHEFKGVIDVEIIPHHEAVEAQIDEALDGHKRITDRVQSVRRASLSLSTESLPCLDHGGDATDTSIGTQSTLGRLVRLQALIRGFLARRRVELLKLDRLVDSRLLQTEPSPPRVDLLGSKMPSWMTRDAVLAPEYEKIRLKLREAVRAKLHTHEDQSGSMIVSEETEVNEATLSTVDYERHTAELRDEQRNLVLTLRHRIQLIGGRLDSMAQQEAHTTSTFSGLSAGAGAPAKVQRAAAVAIVRKRLQQLLQDEAGSQEGKGLPSTSGTRESTVPERKTGVNGLLGSKVLATPRDWEANEPPGMSDKSLGSFDAREINRLADAYEEGEESSDVSKLGASDEPKAVLTTVTNVVIQPEEQHTRSHVAQPLTPRAGPVVASAASFHSGRPGTPAPNRAFSSVQGDDAGRSPRPNMDEHGISPFSKTPLLSRRAASTARRGTGYDNAR